jgi:hypothetical protein
MKSQKVLTPLKAIRKHCLECVGNCREDVRTCTGTDCQPWLYRFGTNPYRKEMTEGERNRRGEQMNLRRKLK